MAYFVYKGYKRGIIFEVASLVGIIAGCYAAIHFSKLVADLLPIEGEATFLIAFLITFLGVVILSKFFGKCIEGVLKLVHVGILNQLLGATLGLAKAVCILSILLNFVILIDHDQKMITQTTKTESIFYSPVNKVGSKMTAKLKIYAEQLKEAKEIKDSTND